MRHTSAALRIVPSAVQHFAEHGYDGASMSKIAEAVGIRKPSLYSHFRSKDELFMFCFKGAVSDEQQCATALLDDVSRDALPGELYCRSFIRRYSTSSSLQLMLRTAYMAPPALAPQVDALFEGYLAVLEDGFIASARRRFSEGAMQLSSEATLREVYVALVDSVQVKLVYTTPELAKYRLDTLRSVIAPLLSIVER